MAIFDLTPLPASTFSFRLGIKLLGDGLSMPIYLRLELLMNQTDAPARCMQAAAHEWRSPEEEEGE